MTIQEIKNLYNKTRDPNSINLINVIKEREFFNYLIEHTPWLQESNGTMGIPIGDDYKLIQIDGKFAIVHSNGNSVDITPDGKIITTGVVIDSGNPNNVLTTDGSNVNIAGLLSAGDNIQIVHESNGKAKISVIDVDTTLYRLVTELPTTNIDVNRLYIIPKDNLTPGQLEDIGGANSIKESDKFIELIYINGKWEVIGGTGVDIDLNDYYTKTDSDGRYLKQLGNNVITDGNLEFKFTSVPNKGLFLEMYGNSPQVNIKESNSLSFQIRVIDDTIGVFKNNTLDNINVTGVKVGIGVNEVVMGNATTMALTEILHKGVTTYPNITFPNSNKIETGTNYMSIIIGNGNEVIRFHNNKLVTTKEVQALKYVVTDGTSSQMMLADGSLKNVSDFAISNHKHTAADINSGILAIERIPTGTGANQIALGNHNHDSLYEPKDVNIQAHIINKSNPHAVTKGQVGLGNVDDTSDANKPVSTAQATAINAKYTKPALGIPKTDLVAAVQTSLGKADTALQSFTETDPTVPSWAKQTNKPAYTATEVGAIPASQKGANNGVAELDSSGKVLSSQLPSYVDDVLEYATSTNFPATGESGKIYIAVNTNLTYRWTGTTYTEISPSIALGETSTTAYRGDRGKTAYDHSQTAHAPSNAQKNSDITKAEIEAKLTGAITTHTHGLYFENITVTDWIADSTYEDYGYRAEINCQGVTSQMFADVVFSPESAVIGLAPVCKTDTNKVTIYAVSDEEVTILTIKAQ